MDRVNHIKIVTPEPEAVNHFLTEVLDIPEGWTLPGDGPSRAQPIRTVATPEGALSWDDVIAHRGGGTADGRITGNPRSGQFQIYPGDTPHIWAVAVGTRHLERAHERCTEHSIPATPIEAVPWGDGVIRAFFAEVGGIVFEVLRVDAGTNS